MSKDRTNLFSDKPEFIIDSTIGKQLINWCNQGISLEAIREEISSSTTLEGLRCLYSKHSALKHVVKPLIMERKAVIENTLHIIENKDIIQTPHSQNGTNNSIT